MSDKTSYVPGVCNINPAEIRNRRTIGHFGLAITIALYCVLIFLQLDWYWGLIIFFPAFLSSTGYLQAQNKFCVGFAAAGQHHADNGETVTITDKKSLELDKAKTRKMNLQATAIATFDTLVVCISLLLTH